MFDAVCLRSAAELVAAARTRGARALDEHGDVRAGQGGVVCRALPRGLQDARAARVGAHGVGVRELPPAASTSAAQSASLRHPPPSSISLARLAVGRAGA
jgi:hypothetical protein